MIKRFTNWLVALALVAVSGVTAGCYTKAVAFSRVHPDGVRECEMRVIGTGDKASQVAADGMFADGSLDDFGAGVRSTSASQQSSGVDGTINALGSLMSIMAQFMANGQQHRVGVGTPAASTMTDSSTDSVSAPAQRTTSVVLSGKVAEAKAANKTLIVVAGNPACSYCTKFNEAVAASTLSTRSDIIFVSESAPWAENSALDWTGGGNAPIVRITRWNADGSIMCDQKLNRPSIAEIEAAITACVAK